MTTEMTRDYETLEDRALDALVAERVFGCKAGNTKWDFICVCGLGVEGVNQDWPAVHWLGETKETDEGIVYTHGEGYIPRYSTDPAAAFTVLEAMAGRGYTSTMCLGPPSFGGFAITISGPNRKLITEGSPDSMPRAAVIAALRALDAREGGGSDTP